MRKRELRVLAVGDPAVSAYVDSKYGILDGYGRDVQFEAVPWENYYNKMTEVFAGKAAYDIVMVAGHRMILCAGAIWKSCPMTLRTFCL